MAQKVSVGQMILVVIGTESFQKKAQELFSRKGIDVDTRAFENEVDANSLLKNPDPLLVVVVVGYSSFSSGLENFFRKLTARKAAKQIILWRCGSTKRRLSMPKQPYATTVNTVEELLPKLCDALGIGIGAE